MREDGKSRASHGGLSRQRDHGHPHIYSVESRRAAAVRKRVQRDVDLAVRPEVIGQTARDETESCGVDSVVGQVLGREPRAASRAWYGRILKPEIGNARRISCAQVERTAGVTLENSLRQPNVMWPAANEGGGDRGGASGGGG